MATNVNVIDGKVNKYRGMGADVSTLSDVPTILDRAKMDWKTVSMPMLIQGKGANRPSGFRSLVRSDNGEELGVSTPDYKPVHNEQIVRSMLIAASEAGGVQLERIGCLDGGRRVWGIGTVPNTSFVLPVDDAWEQLMRNNPLHGWIKGDKTVLKVLIGSGHVPGTAFTIDFQAEREICTNGAKITKIVGRFRLVHSAEFSVHHRMQIRRMMDGAFQHFRTYEQKAIAMRNTHVETAVGTAFTVQLMQPELIVNAVKEGRAPEALLSTKGDNFGGINTPLLLNEAVKVDFFDPQTFSRPVNRVLELVNSQPGAPMAAGTLWNRYNAVTYFVDHERGRTADSGLNAAFFGEGAQIKDQALDLASQYAMVLARR